MKHTVGTRLRNDPISDRKFRKTDKSRERRKKKLSPYSFLPLFFFAPYYLENSYERRVPLDSVLSRERLAAARGEVQRLEAESLRSAYSVSVPTLYSEKDRRVMTTRDSLRFPPHFSPFTLRIRPSSSPGAKRERERKRARECGSETKQDRKLSRPPKSFPPPTRRSSRANFSREQRRFTHLNYYDGNIRQQS